MTRVHTFLSANVLNQTPAPPLGPSSPTPAIMTAQSLIPVVIVVTGQTLAKRDCKRFPPSDQCNLQPVPKQSQSTTVMDNHSQTVKFALWNVRSLTKKSFLINDLISTNNLDFLFLTETWLDSVNHNITLIESAPPNYLFLGVNRENRRGGGIATIFKDSFHCKLSTYGQYDSFEYLCGIVRCCPKILLLTIYRPPNLSVVMFLEEFCELLSEICVPFDSIIISGDFNLHIDKFDNPHSRDFLALLDTFNLTQHVQGPTHSQGHTLDLVITKGVTVSLDIKELGVSDHRCIFFNACLPAYSKTTSLVTSKRLLNDNTSALFEQALVKVHNPLEQTADGLLDYFNLVMTQIMDEIAPYKVKALSGKQKAPWMKNPLVTSQKKGM